MPPDFGQIVSQFQFDGRFLRADLYGYGHINDTYLAQFKNSGSTPNRYILQRVNHRIFRQPENLMANVEGVTTHLRRKIIDAGGNPNRETLNLIPAVNGKSFCVTPQGHYWRAYLFIENALTYQEVERLEHIYNAAAAFGTFQKRLSDFPADRLHETIPNFHHTPSRFEAFEQAVARDSHNRAQSAATEIAFAMRRSDEVSALTDLLARGELPQRVTHNDTKFNNVMIDDKTGEGICVIDLDTVMPGLSLYDFGDLVRSAANIIAEDEPNYHRGGVNLPIFDALAHGYLDVVRDTLVSAEIDRLVLGSKLMVFECGIRFLADYLNGDTYFKIGRQSHNLDRCRTQFRMVADMEMKAEQLAAIIEKYRF